MARPSEIETVQERRRILLAESEQLRQQLAADAARLQAAAAWVDTGYSLAQSLRTYWPLFAAAAGFVIARRRGGWMRSLGKLWSVWKVARKLKPVWHLFSAARNS